MIVLLTTDADDAARAALLTRARELELELTPLEGSKGLAYEVLGAGRGRALELRGAPAVAEILTRRKALSGGEPLWPHFVLRLSILAILAVAALALLAVVWPPPLGSPLDGAPTITAVEWYLRPPAALVDALPSLGPVLAALFWLVLLLWPFLDRLDPARPAGRAFGLACRALAVVLLLACAALVFLGGAS
jgi:quinol-cytochrome oxidoreductase complex cytochrome b subunit